MTAVDERAWVTPTPDPRFLEVAPPPGYRLDHEVQAWRSLPWPDDVRELPPSLGWGVIAWAEANLVHHLHGTPWRFTKAQKRFLVLWLAVKKPDGSWLYRKGTLRRAKGVGKDPFGAAWLLCSAFGPVEFAGWNERGEPVGRPRRRPLVQVAANSEAQGKDLLHVANGMVSKKLKAAVGYTGGKVASASKSGARLEVITASEATAEGDPVDDVVLNESHHMTESSGGVKIAKVAARNAAKSPDGHARVLELTNAWENGSDCVAEANYKAWQDQVAGRTLRQDILYDSCEAPSYLSLHKLEDVARGLRAAYADAPWASLERLAGEMDDTSGSVADSIRFYFNQTADNESKWVDANRYDACAVEDGLADREQIALFLDCSKSSDATALEAARISDGLAVHGKTWQKPRGDRGKGWLAPRDEVDATVREFFARFKVVWFGIDPSPATDDDTERAYWADVIEGLVRDFGRQVVVKASASNPLLFDMRMSSPGGRERNRAFTEQAMTTATAIEEKRFRHDGNPIRRVHVHNAHQRSNPWGTSLGKRTRDSDDKVDNAVAMVGAQLGRTLVIQSGKLRRPGGVKARRW